ncbi:MAG: galactose mutarotase [Bacteroidetes bacterium]|nr:galactose mutarotase [Bacteroidota bacterium]
MKSNFGKIGDRDVFLYTLTNKHGITVKITNYGGIITEILMPGKDGKNGNIVLGYDNLPAYVANSPYFGAIVGRYANRIANGEFTLNGVKYKLARNNVNNALHGGIKGFDKVVWDARENSDTAVSSLNLTYTSPDGEEGYPGNLKVEVNYTLNNNDELLIMIEAASDKATIVNICNHSYFNLNGANSDILNHILTIPADQYTEVNDQLIPTGRLREVKGTPMDFNKPTQVGAGIDKVNGGYDHNYVLRKKTAEMSVAAVLFDPGSGREVTIETTQPGVQFYSGNFLDGSIKGTEGKVYRKHYGLCLETQHFPDSPNQPLFPSTILNPGMKYLERTTIRFSVIE